MNPAAPAQDRADARATGRHGGCSSPGVDKRTLRPVGRHLFWAVGGLALGAVGIGWHGRPSDAAIVAAIRGRSAAHARATITLRDVDRNWFHEIFGNATSEFLVTATVVPPDAPGGERCFRIEPAPIPGTAIAFGPYEQWRCDYPF
jgi:hypothetical protein